MKTLRKQVIVSILITIVWLVALGIVCAMFALDVWVPAAIGLLIVLGCAFMIVCAIRDYRFYRQLSSQMEGKKPQEKLDIIFDGMECWLVYATREEVKELVIGLQKTIGDDRQDYFFERAASHGKLNY